MKLGKVLVVIVFALALCWGLSQFLNLNVVSFNLGGVGITRTMLAMVFGAGMCMWLWGKR